MSDLLDLKRILKKMLILNATAMAEIRSKPYITLEGNADYQDRYRQANWLADSIGDIEESERLDAIEDVSFARDTLKANIQRKLEARYDDILDKTRKLGAGTMDTRISQDDRKFLRSCGIKTERGEKWLP